MGSSYVKAKELDLTSAHTDEEIPVGAQSFRVRTDSEVTVRFDSPGNPTRELKAGSVTRFCKKHPGESFDAIYVTNAAASGQLELEIEHDFIIEPEPGEDASSLPQPERLTGDLAATTDIADGAEASEDVDTADAESIRVRVKASGMSSVEIVGEVSDATDIGNTRAVAYDEANQIVYTGNLSGLIGIVDASSPENPSILATFTDPAFSTVVGLVYDPTREKLYALGDDGSNFVLAVIDVDNSGSTPSLSVDGTVDPAANSDTAGASRYFLALDESLGHVFLMEDSGLQSRSVQVDVATNPASPSVVDSASDQPIGLDTSTQHLYTGDVSGSSITAHPYGAGGMGTGDTLSLSAAPSTSVNGQVDEDDGLLLLFDADDNWVVIDVSTPASLEELGKLDDGTGSPEGTALDPDNDRLAAGWSGNDFRVISYADPDNPKRVSRTTDAHQRLTSIVYAEDTGTWWGVQGTDDQLSAFGDNPGEDRVTLIPLLTDGSEASTGTTQATIRDGVESMLDLDLGGEDQVRVLYEGRSGEQATIDYVEQYRR